MKRETINLDADIIQDILYNDSKEYIVIEDDIISSDPEDGGSDHDV